MLSRQDILNLGEGRAFWKLSFNVERMSKFVLVLVGVLADLCRGQCRTRVVMNSARPLKGEDAYGLWGWCGCSAEMRHT